MKYLLLGILAGILILSCNKKDCKFCFSYAQPLRFSILNSSDENLLDSTIDGYLEVSTINTKSNSTINFRLTSMIGGFETGFWFIESIDDICIDEECELYVSYTNSNPVDTLNILYEQFREVDDDGCVCTSYPLKYFKHNGVEISEFNTETKGATIIRK